MTSPQLLAQRLASHALSTPAATVLEACRRLGAMQAQDPAQVRWALGVRVAGATAATVDEAYARGELVRTWPMRGTLHVVPAEDAPWMTRLFRERNLARAARRLRETEIGARDVVTARKVVEKALAKGRLPRARLFEVLERAGQRVTAQRGVYLLWHLAQDGVVCLAGGDFALVDEIVPRPRALDGDEALALLATRYFTGHAPATSGDFAFWSGLPKGEAERATAMTGPLAAPIDAGIPDALLLPGFDEYFLGYADRSPTIEMRHFDRVVPGGNGVFQAMVVLAGRVRGTWRRRITKDRVAITVSPFSKPSKKETRAIEDRVADVGAFYGRAVEVTFEAPDARAR